MERAIKSQNICIYLIFSFCREKQRWLHCKFEGHGCSGVFVFGCKKVEDWNCKFEIYGSYNNDLCFILDNDLCFILDIESIWGITERDQSIFKILIYMEIIIRGYIHLYKECVEFQCMICNVNDLMSCIWQ